MVAVVSKDCTGCSGLPVCLALCPVLGAISYERNEYDYPFGRVRIVPELCIGCGLCITRRYEAAVIDPVRCEGCQECIAECHFDAIELVQPERSAASRKRRRSKKLKARVDREKCVGCGVCWFACSKTGALTLEPVNPDDYDDVQLEGCPSDAITLVAVR